MAKKLVMALVMANLAKRAAMTVFCRKCHLPHVIPTAASTASKSKQFSSKCEKDQGQDSMELLQVQYYFPFQIYIAVLHIPSLSYRK